VHVDDVPRGRFGGEAYAAAELIAEMGTAFLCAHCRIDGQLQHTSYLSSWLRALRADKRDLHRVGQGPAGGGGTPTVTCR